MCEICEVSSRNVVVEWSVNGLDLYEMHRACPMLGCFLEDSKAGIPTILQPIIEKSIEFSNVTKDVFFHIRNG